ncbi:hypothetical protein SANTM175S_08533 [Streptomyces antimycoticus]
MLPEEFEEYARLAGRVAEGVRWEFINGKIRVTPVPDGDHGRIIQWLARICIQAHPDLWLHDQGLKVETYRNGHAPPDGTLAHSDAFVGQGEWADADPVLMVVEVTSYDSDTDRRDRVEKPRAYAETGIPVICWSIQRPVRSPCSASPTGSGMRPPRPCRSASRSRCPRRSVSRSTPSRSKARCAEGVLTVLAPAAGCSTGSGGCGGLE